MTFNDNQINLPRVVTIKLKDKNQNQILDEERTPTLPHNAQTRNYMSYFGLQCTGDYMNNITKI